MMAGMQEDRCGTKSTPVLYRVGGMDCPSCASKIEVAVSRLAGVTKVSVSALKGTMSVEGGETERIQAQVRALGYTVDNAGISASLASSRQDQQDHNHNNHTHHDHTHGHDHSQDARQHVHADPGDLPLWHHPKARLIAFCAVALGFAYLVGVVEPQLGQWPFLAALVIGLVPIARHAFAAARAGSPFSIEMLMTISAGGAFIIGAAEEAAMVVLLFLVGELLEGFAAQRARAGIQGLTNLVPDVALVEESGQLREMPATALEPGMVIIVRPGDRIAADGVLLAGESAINEAPVTGESIPKLKLAGERVFAGTINTDAVISVEVTARAADNTIARIVRLVEEAQEAKAPFERFIDRFAARYTPMVLVLGFLVAIVPPLFFGQGWETWIYRGLAVLLIGCPCALVISTPAAIAAGLSAGARRGLLMKGGGVLEALRRVTIVAFDKTGTLTEGRPVVTDVLGFNETEDNILSLAAALERNSSHPLAAAILAKAESLAIPEATAVRALAGKGLAGLINGQNVALLSPRALGEIELSAAQADVIAALNAAGKTVSILTVDNRVAGLIALRDELRPDAKEALQNLKAKGVKAIMLTGDNQLTAKAIAQELGIEAYAEMMPEDKSLVVRALQDEGEVVAKVGDGINDAPALAAADIGIAMGGGTDVALETADAAALYARMQDIPALIDLSRATITNIWQNIAVALGLKGVFLITTIVGLTGLWPAIMADTGATVLVTANAIRLLRWRG